MPHPSQPPHISQYLPLHTGRSFICYRDVNRAIEKHRELYGLRLVLKRAVKLENYCLTVDQMRDLNFRLKYGQLDYQCSVDNGRPGRPGNDERCPRLVRLRLSPDARTLVVYDTHIHDSPSLPLPVSLPSSSTATSTYTSSSSFSSSSSASSISTTTTTTTTHLKPIAPKSVPTPETVTVLSVPFSQSPSATHTTIHYAPTPIYSSPHLSITPIENPHTQQAPLGITSTQSSSLSSSSMSASPLSSHEKITVKLKKSQFSPNEMVVVGSARHAREQLELRNSPEKSGGGGGGGPSTPTGIVAQKIAPKGIPRQQQQQQQVAHRFADGSFSVAKVVRRPVGRNDKAPSERPRGRPPLNRPAIGRPPLARGDKVWAPLHPSAPGRPGARLGGSAYSNGNSHTNGIRSLTAPGRRMTKKKRAKQSVTPSLDLSMITPLDTELEVGEKQQLAHGVLLRLLRVTSQLPMIQFSHALDTLETLTDAYKLEQRVNITINHDHEEETENFYHPDDTYYTGDMEAEDEEEEEEDDDGGVTVVEVVGGGGGGGCEKGRGGGYYYSTFDNTVSSTTTTYNPNHNRLPTQRYNNNNNSSNSNSSSSNNVMVDDEEGEVVEVEEDEEEKELMEEEEKRRRRRRRRGKSEEEEEEENEEEEDEVEEVLVVDEEEDGRLELSGSTQEIS